MRDISFFTGQSFYPVVAFEKERDKLLALDLTEQNRGITPAITGDTVLFSEYIQQALLKANARYGIGGYLENRTVYSRSKVFAAADAGEEPRSVHLGVDIWAAAGTEVFAPLDGEVHSFAFNNQYGDYGATLILVHGMGDSSFHTLYGHLALRDLQGLYAGKKITAGDLIAHFGEAPENGHWPPHLHFQVIWDMEGKKGDYPGVCRLSDKEKYAANCPDPDLILKMVQFSLVP